MGNLIKTVGHGGDNIPFTKRSIGLLSDGSVIALVADMNQVGVSGDGGDNTGVPKYYFYHSTDRVNWTLRATVNAPGAHTFSIVSSFCVDSANNLHLAYRWYTGSAWQVRYRKLTYGAGPTWSVGSDVTVASAAPTGYAFISGIDIDTIANSTEAVVIGAYWYNTAAGQRKTGVQQYVRTTGGSWVAHATDAVISNESHLGYTDDMTISGDNVGAVSGDGTSVYAWYCTRKGANSVDHGDVLYVIKYHMTTGARVGKYAIQTTIHQGAGGGYRKLWLFNTGENQWTLAGVVDLNGFRTSVYRFQFNRLTNTKQDLTPRAVSPSRDRRTTFWRLGFNHNWAAAAYNGSDEVFFFGNAAGYAAVGAAKISGSSVSFDENHRRWDNSYGDPSGTWDVDGKFKAPTVAPLSQLFSGATRNWGVARLDVMLFHNRGTIAPVSYRVESRSILVPDPPNQLRPAASSTVTTDRPTVSANLRLKMYYPQLLVKSQWQVASDAGFTTNLKTITEPDSEFEAVFGTSSPYNSIVWHSRAIGAIDELFQGTWYVRSRTQDYSGNFSSWSSAVSFVVSHPPQGSDLYPTSSAVFLYGDSGQVTFSWKFTDPSPFDAQTAYQIVVENAQDGTVLVDSGKTLSSNQTAVLSIPVGGKDIELRWKLTLWDSDDVAGPASSYQIFYVADPPVPAITAPVDLAVITTGIPTIEWTPGLGGTKTQSRYRVMITQGQAVIYNSAWVDSSDNSHIVPVGHLANDQQYTVRVEVQDSLGLQGSSSIAISTDWVEPLGPSDDWEVYTHEYASRGFVYVTWRDTNMDSDFSSWNVYRRKRGESGWSLVAAVTSGSDRYAVRDYFLASGQVYDYTLTQMVDRFGDFVESTPTKLVRITPESSRYWIIDPVEPDKSIPLYNVTGDNFSEEYEEETIHVIGKGRLVEYGDRLGHVGSLSLQLRDRFTTGALRENYALNPALSFISASGDLPNRWTTSEAGSVGTISHGPYEAQNPSPSGKTPYRIYAESMGTTGGDSVTLEQRLLGEEFPAKMRAVGVQLFLSAWVAVSASNVDKRFQLSVGWLDVDGVETGTQQNSAPLDPVADGLDVYIPSSSPDASRGNATEIWRRIYFMATVPSPVPAGVTVKIRLMGNGGGAPSIGELILGGVQLEAGQLTDYFDGSQLDGEWAGDPYLSYSYGSGYYTARQQRQALEDMKSRKTAVYLRNPFGDILSVAVGDIATRRIAGVTAEFVDVDIPYKEVSL